ncbi:MAG: hypothetical protein JNM40_21275 [Myxococcales bacterium]|nr:hypothetical protein [Myxococcales bacterium]
MAQILTLEKLAEAVREKLVVPTEFMIINTRIILQTGVNLRRIRAEQNHDRVLLRKVHSALHKLGVSVEGELP